MSNAMGNTNIKIATVQGQNLAHWSPFTVLPGSIHNAQIHQLISLASYGRFWAGFLRAQGSSTSCVKGKVKARRRRIFAESLKL